MLFIRVCQNCALEAGMILDLSFRVICWNINGPGGG